MRVISRRRGGPGGRRRTDNVGLADRGEPSPQAEPPRDEQTQERRERHHAEATDLDEREDDGLSERRPERPVSTTT